MSCDFKHVLEKTVGTKALGPSPKFSKLDLLLALEFISEGPIGRNKLSISLAVGEGVTRTIISRLTKAGLIQTSKAGCSLTEKGSRLWKEYASVFKKTSMDKNELATATYNFAIVARNLANKVRSGIEQRDAAIVAGAKSAVTMVVKKGRLSIPSVSGDPARDFPAANSHVMSLLRPRENDVVIIGSSGSLRDAERGTLAAAWSLLDKC